MAKLRADKSTGDLFAVSDVFPAAQRQDLPRAIDFNVMLSQLISQAMRETHMDRKAIAGLMSQILGETITENMLNAYASPGRPDHNISLVRFLAFARAAQQPWLWAEVLRDEGITILIGDEARLAQLGHAEAMRRDLDIRIKQLKQAVPSALMKRELS